MTLTLTSRFGQRYQCSYQERHNDQEKKKEKDEEQEALETGVPDLLKPMENGPCLVHVGFWE